MSKQKTARVLVDTTINSINLKCGQLAIGDEVMINAAVKVGTLCGHKSSIDYALEIGAETVDINNSTESQETEK